MATRSRASRLARPLLYTAGAAAVGGGVLYATVRPRDIPGTEAAQVPPPEYGAKGNFQLPAFPKIKSRDEQIADLKRSGGVTDTATATEKGKSKIAGLVGKSTDEAKPAPADAPAPGDEEPYDLLIIGGGATGTGIALDAASRGLKVAVVERDDFSSGTSSKSTKLVHGGVRYLEKAVWELDYNQ